MQEGIYRLVYAGAGYSALGLFVVRNERFTGVGQAGAEYSGSVKFQPARNLYVFEGEGKFPPNTTLVIGSASSPVGTVVPLRGELSAPNPSTRFSLDFAGRAVDVAMSYVAPLPA